jgi:hypothetical protein
MPKMRGAVFGRTISPWAVPEPLQGRMDGALVRMGRLTIAVGCPTKEDHLLDVLGYSGRGTCMPRMAPRRDDRTPPLIVGAREHHARYLGTASIAAHAWCECRERHT